ncbi:MAG TPA: 23S rRNA (adenine(2503)-C(2))-methyltransferase RlmN, partial [Parvularculaceae bacterium]|nr:23S rRNA (adenine(2503)-C(2))-methyltransferase RlmN [Parvularculaceae bacterium]
MTELSLERPASAAPSAPINIAGATRGGLAHALGEAFDLTEKQARMRATQIWRWVYHYGHTDFERMTDIGKEMRTALAEKFVIARPEIVERQVSVDGTRKYLLRMGPGVEVECVYIPDVGRSGALCVSSQVGCTLNCTFCHTGTQKLVRNLTTTEIVGQVLAVKDDLEEWPSGGDDRKLSNIVFMGMGEPLYNL